MLGVLVRSRGCHWPTQSWGNAELQPCSGISSLRVLLPMLCLSFPWGVGGSGQQHQLIHGTGKRVLVRVMSQQLRSCDATCYWSILTLSCRNTLPEKCGAGGAETPLALSTRWECGGIPGAAPPSCAEGLIWHCCCSCCGVVLGLGKGNRDSGVCWAVAEPLCTRGNLQHLPTQHPLPSLPPILWSGVFTHPLPVILC